MTDTAAAHSVLLLDFDGTVCVGDGPVWSYAESLLTALIDEGAPGGLGEDVRARLGAFLDGAPSAPRYLDGYAAVAAIAAQRASNEQLQAAYRASRRALAEGAVTVTTPPGLASFLHAIGPSVERVLVTNAPADGVVETLLALGLKNAFDRIVTDAGKPAGWNSILPGILAETSPENVFTVGDIWHNDLAAPIAAGCMAGLIDRFGHRAGPAHLTAATFEELYPGIREWAADPAAFAAEHPLTAATDARSPSRTTV